MTKNYPNVGPRGIRSIQRSLSSPCRAKRAVRMHLACTVIRPQFRCFTTPWYLRGPSFKWPPLMLQEGLIQEGFDAFVCDLFTIATTGCQTPIPGTRSNAAITTPGRWLRGDALLELAELHLRLVRQATIGFAPTHNPGRFQVFLHRGRRLGQSLCNSVKASKQIDRIEVKWGKLRVRIIVL